jgi:hypothetical protein
VTPLDAIFAYAKRAGVAAISQRPGCWEVAVDEHWWFAVNGHILPESCSRGPFVEPFGVYIEYQGWPAAILDVNGVGEFAAGDVANAAAFVAALAAKP